VGVALHCGCSKTQGLLQDEDDDLHIESGAFDLVVAGMIKVECTGHGNSAIE